MTAPVADDLPLLLRIRAWHGGALLIFFGLLNAATYLVMMLETRGPHRPATYWLFRYVPWSRLEEIPVMVICLIASLVIAFAGLHLRQFGSPWTVRVGCVLAMLPITSTWMLGVPLALNALFVLRAPLVKAKFAR